MIHIVLADDHALIRNSLSRMLATQPDFEVVGIASDGQEALEMVRQHSPEVVLMDLHMPVVDGVAAIEVLHEGSSERLRHCTQRIRGADAGDCGARCRGRRATS